jgi:hypothetical protein
MRAMSWRKQMKCKLKFSKIYSIGKAKKYEFNNNTIEVNKKLAV